MLRNILICISARRRTGRDHRIMPNAAAHSGSNQDSETSQAIKRTCGQSFIGRRGNKPPRPGGARTLSERPDGRDFCQRPRLSWFSSPLATVRLHRGDKGAEKNPREGRAVLPFLAVADLLESIRHALVRAMLIRLVKRPGCIAGAEDAGVGYAWQCAIPGAAKGAFGAVSYQVSWRPKFFREFVHREGSSPPWPRLT